MSFRTSRTLFTLLYQLNKLADTGLRSRVHHNRPGDAARTLAHAREDAVGVRPPAAHDAAGSVSERW